MLSYMVQSFLQLPQALNILMVYMPMTVVANYIAHGKQIPLQEVPMLIGNPDSICKSLQKEQNSRITFSYNGEVYPAQDKALELVPFFPPAQFPLCRLFPAGKRRAV